MYNFRLKSYKNGTAQLTYFHRPIRDKDDGKKIKPATLFDMMTDEQYDEYLRHKNLLVDDYSINLTHETFLDYLDGYEVFKNTYPAEYEYESPFGDYIPEYNLLEVKYEPLRPELTQEELEERKRRSIQSSLNRSKRKIYDYGRGNVWDWFFTLTFERVDEFTAENFDECKKKVSGWFNNIKKRYCKNIKYLSVPEQHESGAWHFHCLVSNCDELDFEVAINNQKYRKDKKTGEYLLDENGNRILNKYFGQELRTRYPDGDYIYNINQYKNGFSTATRIADTKKAVSYVIKYVTEELTEVSFGKRRYLPSKNLDLPVETYALLDKNELGNIITDIEYKFGLKMSIDYIKTYSIDVENYSNKITIFEFALPQGDVEYEKLKTVKLNEIVEDWYE